MLGMQAGADCKSLFVALSLFLRSVTKGAHVSNSRLGTYWCIMITGKRRKQSERYRGKHELYNFVVLTLSDNKKINQLSQELSHFICQFKYLYTL